jgi:hypothetical protein
MTPAATLSREQAAQQVVCVLLPLKIVSVANLSEHWTAKAKRTRLHREAARVLLRRHSAPKAGPVTITLTRIASREMDGDNLQSAFKACRDGVADWLGIDDGHPWLTWVYAQRTGKPGMYAAEVTVSWGVQP